MWEEDESEQDRRWAGLPGLANGRSVGFAEGASSTSIIKT